MVKTCYICGVPLIHKSQANTEELERKAYASVEHIIPNFCGGKRTSNSLLCEKHNNEFGHELEAKFQEELILSKLLHFKKRGKDSFFVPAITQSGKKILVKTGFKPHIEKPIVEFKPDKSLKRIVVEDEKSAKETIRNLIRKQRIPALDDYIQQFRWEQNYINEPVYFPDFKVGSDICFRSITKIICNFYLWKDGEQRYIKKLVPYLLGKEKNIFVSEFYYPWIPPYIPDDDEVSHVLFIKGDKRKKLLYGYVELFSVHCFIVILDTNYDGPDFENQYCYDVLKNHEFDHKKVDIALFRNPIEPLKYTFLYTIWNRQAQEEHHKRLDKLFKCLSRIGYKISSLDDAKFS